MSTTNRGRKRQAPTVSSNNSETNDNLSADDGISLPGTATFDETFSQVSGGRRRRRRFSSQRRNEVAKVRKVGACPECRARKVRCLHALRETDANPVPAPDRGPTQKPSPQRYPFVSEPFPDASYPEAIREHNAEQGHQLDDVPHQDLSFIDGSDLIDKVAAYTTRKNRLGLYLGDIDNIIGDGSGGGEATNFSDRSAWGQNSEWVINATTPTNNQPYSQPSTTYPYSHPNFSTDLGPSLSTPASSTVDHPEVLGSPIELPTANISERDVQTDRLAQVNEFIAGQYAAGMEESLTVGSDHNTSGDFEFLDINNWCRAQSYRDPTYRRVQRDHRMRRSNSPLQRQPSIMNTDNPAQKLQDHSRGISSNQGIDFTSINTDALFQKPASRGRHTMKRMANFVPSQHHRTNSPAPSLSGQFERRMKISDQPYPYKIPDRIEEDVSGASLQRDRLQVFAINNNVPHFTSATFGGEEKSMMSLKRYKPDSYDNFELAQSGVSFSPDYSGSSIGMPAWSGGGPSTPLVHSGSSYPPPSLKTDIPNTGYLATEGPIDFPLSAVAAKQPMIMLNDEPMLHNDLNEEFACALNLFSLDPTLSQGYSGSNLDYSTMSSSGASGSLLSLVDAHNPLAENYGDDWDSSSYTYGHDNMDVNTNDEMT